MYNNKSENNEVATNEDEVIINNEKPKKNTLRRIIYTITDFVMAIAVGIIVFGIIQNTGIVYKVSYKIATNTINKSIERYDISANDNYNFVYYDHNIYGNERLLLEKGLDRLDYLHDEFKENNLRIIVTKNSIKDTLALLIKDRVRTNLDGLEKYSGGYLPEYNLLIISNYTVDSIHNIFTETVSDLDFKTLLKLAEVLNNGVLYHELGHFLDDITENKLRNNEEFVNLYETEKDLIFNSEEDDYYKQSIAEYIAECTSMVFEYQNGLLKENNPFINTKTYEVITKHIEQFK